MNIIVKGAAIAMAICGLGLGSVQAAEKADEAAAKVKTVFVEGHGQGSFADKVNKTHAEMTAKGWKFANFNLYTENGDMKGAFVTYTRE